MSIFSKKLYDISMRNIQKDALILSVKPSGENNRLVTFLTKEDGILSAMLYGGPKSHLRSLASPFNFGRIFLYNDEAKHSSKVTDFDVKKYHLSFRESLFKTWAASLASEVVLLSQCGGSPEECFILLNGFLDGLELLDERSGKAGLIRFLWRYLEILGVQVTDYNCSTCRRPFYSGNLRENTLQYRAGGAIYSHSENGFICQECCKATFENPELQSHYALSSRSVVYLNATSMCEPSVSRKMELSEDEMNSLKTLVFSLIENALGTKIKTLQSGIGIL